MKDQEYIESLAYQDLMQRPPLTKDQSPRPLREVIERRILDRDIESQAPSTGYPRLDSMIKGFIPGRLYTMTGETNVGKTAMACNFAYRVSQQGGRVLYFALEPDRTIVDYLVSIHHEKPFSQITNDDLDSYENDFIHVYGSEQVRGIETLVDAVDRLDRYDLVIIDHIGYFVKTNTSNFYAEQGNVLKQLALLSQRKASAIMLIAHLNKSASITPDNWIPGMNQISGSSAFKQDSDDVLIVAREPKETGMKGVTIFGDEGVIAVAKTKAGKGGYCPVVFVDGTAAIVDKEKQMAETVTNINKLMF